MPAHDDFHRGYRLDGGSGCPVTSGLELIGFLLLDEVLDVLVRVEDPSDCCAAPRWRGGPQPCHLQVCDRCRTALRREPVGAAPPLRGL